MGNTVAEIEQALTIANQLLPFAATFFPPAQPWVPLFQVLAQAVNTVAQDTGKPLDQVISDVINHLTPGAPAAPSLT